MRGLRPFRLHEQVGQALVRRTDTRSERNRPVVALLCSQILTTNVHNWCGDRRLQERDGRPGARNRRNVLEQRAEIEPQPALCLVVHCRIRVDCLVKGVCRLWQATRAAQRERVPLEHANLRSVELQAFLPARLGGGEVVFV